MYIPKISLTRIFIEALQNFQGGRLSKIYGFRQKERQERHNFPPLRKTGIKIPSNGHFARFASDGISKNSLFAVRHYGRFTTVQRESIQHQEAVHTRPKTAWSGFL